MLKFIMALNSVWRLYRLGTNLQASPADKEVLDKVFAEYPEMSWFSGFFPPTYPRYKDGKRI